MYLSKKKESAFSKIVIHIRLVSINQQIKPQKLHIIYKYIEKSTTLNTKQKHKQLYNK